jgi:hypothetical protein
MNAACAEGAPIVILKEHSTVRIGMPVHAAERARGVILHVALRQAKTRSHKE